MKGRGLKIFGVAVLVVVVVVFALSLVLDSILTSKAREQADKLSKEWNRPVTIGSVATKFLTGLGVRVSDVEIGPAQGEKLPLVTLKRVEVKAALLKAALSRGKDVEVRSAEVQGLTVNIVKFADGTTNLERFQKQLPPSKPEEPAAKKESDLSFLRVDHAALVDGEVQLVDETNGGNKQLGVKHLDVTVNDLQAGKPLEVLVKAAVLAEKQNLQIRLKAAPLPASLTPTPEQVSLHVDPPIDLAPLGPFAGKELGLERGTLDADFDANLGDQIAVKGGIKAAGLRFASGKPFDITVDTDVVGNANAGDVQINKLRVDLGPAGINGKGSAKGLKSAAPQIAGLTITSHDLDPAVLAEYYPPLRKQLAGMISGPVGLDVHASGTQQDQALELKVDLTPVKLDVPEQLTKAKGAPMTLTAHVRGAAASNGPVRFDVAMDLEGVDLRPGQSVDKAPKQRLDLAIAGTRAAERIELQNIKAHILEDELQGHGSFETHGQAKKFELALESSRLDLDKMLLESKKKKESKPLDPKTFDGLSGHATVKIDLLRQKKQELRNIVADVTMQEDHIVVTKASLQAFGGTADASGTELFLAHPKEPFKVALKVKDVELANAVALGTDKKILGGKFTGNVDLRGGGQAMQELAKTLAGVMDGHIADGAFYGKDLIAGVTGPLVKALPSQLAGRVTDGGRTDLGKDLPFGVTLENGVAKLKQPIKVTRPEAELSFSGGIRVDGNLDMPGTVSLTPQTIAAITGGKVKLTNPIPVTVRLSGPAWSPSLGDLDLKPAVTEIVKQAGSALLGQALGVGNVDQAQQQAQQRAQAEAKKAQDKAAAEAEAQKKKLEDEAKNRLKGLFGR